MRRLLLLLVLTLLLRLRPVAAARGWEVRRLVELQQPRLRYLK
jgi:hypothetical protein